MYSSIGDLACHRRVVMGNLSRRCRREPFGHERRYSGRWPSEKMISQSDEDQLGVLTNLHVADLDVAHDVVDSLTARVGSAGVGALLVAGQERAPVPSR